MSLYQKYRPKDFDSLAWQEFVKISLSNALKQWKIVWAYLFYWSRWTWKTTTARILAKWFNCLSLKDNWNPCLECENCSAFERQELLDIIEIDAASNTWVDNIRDLIERAQFQPNQSKYKVYIIDEVHMLSKWAFNALLKILEEPPEHVKFILATTEIHKIPETIISRTQRYDFKRITEQDIINRLEFIGKSENISTEKEALALIARLSKWWLRDAISLFEQYSIWWSLKLEYLRANLQLVWDDFLGEFIVNICQKDKDKILANLQFLKEKWIDVKVFIEEIVFYLRDKIIASFWENIFHEYIKIFEIFEDLYWKLRFVPNTFSLLEIWVLKLISNPVISVNVESIESFQIKKEENKAASSEIQNKKTSEIITPSADESDKKVNHKKEETSEDIKETKFETDPKSFNAKEFIESIKKDSWKWFVAMSIRASRFEVSWNKFCIFANNEFNLWKLGSPEILSYLSKKTKDLFWFEYEIQVELDNWKENLLGDAMDVF